LIKYNQKSKTKNEEAFQMGDKSPKKREKKKKKAEKNIPAPALKVEPVIKPK
jgi:hypothetical protein